MLTAGVRIGVDTGGTFTDFVALAGGRVLVHKVRSTPDDPSRAIVEGIGELVRTFDGLEVVHGSTVATNAVLERKGARVALVATAGFEDVLRIGRQTRKELYNFLVEDRRPLVEPALTFGIAERTACDGTELEPIAPEAVEALASAVTASGADVVAVCLLHAYANPEHERRVTARLAAAGLRVSPSHVVLPEYREFERASTTVLNAYVTPLMATYLEKLEERLGRDVPLRVMQSNGGSISAASAKSAAARTVLSGPAAGAVGAHVVAAASGFAKTIAFDMGGTSTDVTLLDGGLSVTMESTIGDVPVRLPVIDIHTVGAGGGSIAYVDSGGALRVGPRSAGAVPGPVCYGTGTELTVTDANLVLGRLEPEYFLGGRMALDVDRARAAMRAFAPTVGLSETALAEGIVRIANANMERAIRVVSVERGHDPRDFALVAFGGAGGMHACALADALDIPSVVMPPHAGVLSALGLLLADVARDYSQSVLRTTDVLSPAELDRLFAPLVARAEHELAAEGFDASSRAIERAVDVRYVGQSFEITVPFTQGYREEFDRRHQRLYGYANPRRTAEVVNVRVRAAGLTEKPALRRAPEAPSRPAVPDRVRPAWFGGRSVETAVYRADGLEPGVHGHGPAIVAGAQATMVVPPGFAFRVDETSAVIVTRTNARRRPASRRDARGTRAG